MNFQSQLKRQLGFIEKSCSAFDSGDHEEALRIAVSLRVLFHDTKNSTSLLSHLGVKENVNIISSLGTGKNKEQLENVNIISIPCMIGPGGRNPPLDKALDKKTMNAIDWWNEVVMVENESFSRKDIILSAANQDGGAHVDSKPSLKTQELKSGIGTYTISINGIKQSIDLESKGSE